LLQELLRIAILMKDFRSLLIIEWECPYNVTWGRPVETKAYLTRTSWQSTPRPSQNVALPPFVGGASFSAQQHMQAAVTVTPLLVGKHS
jgi:hypothetical protein